MVDFLRLKNTGSDTVGLQAMSTSDKAWVAWKFGSYIVNNPSNYMRIQVSTSNPGGTWENIGSFVDTFRDPIGTHPTTTVYSSTTGLYQVRQPSVADRPSLNDSNSPVYLYNHPTNGWGSRISSSGVNSSYQFEDSMMPAVAAHLAGLNIGSYSIQPNNPGGSGKTWIARDTITDFARSGSTTTTLWQCTASPSPTEYRPVYANDSGTSGDFQEYSDSGVDTLVKCIHTRSWSSSGVGSYVFQTSAPTTGTWVKMGASITDTRQTVSPSSYVSNTSGNFTGYYARDYAGTYTGTYIRDFAGAYAGAYRMIFSGFAGPQYVGYYTGYYRGYFTGNYTGYFRTNYAGTYTAYYTGYYAGATVTSNKETVSSKSLWLRTA